MGFFSIGCAAPSEEEVQADFNRIVDKSNACAADSECVLVSPGCPLGCSVAVNREQASRVERAARDLIDDYESGGRSCDYDCVGPLEPVCVSEKCELVEPEAEADAGAQ
jgi:hypothetical protein